MDRTNRNEDKPSRIESQQKPPTEFARLEGTISELFLALFKDLPGSPLYERKAEAVDPDRQWLLDDVLSRCATPDSGCWEWKGARNAKGYGRIKHSGRLVSPHRAVAWAMGIVPTLNDPARIVCVLHECDNPRCCNPKHLKAGSMADNMRDCARRGRIANQKNPWKPKQPKKVKAAGPTVKIRGGKWVLTPANEEQEP